MEINILEGWMMSRTCCEDLPTLNFAVRSPNSFLANRLFDRLSRIAPRRSSVAVAPVKKLTHPKRVKGSGSCSALKFSMKLFVIVSFFIFMISSVYALGVTPARTTVDFEPGLKRSIGYEAITSGTDTNLVISAQGELAEYISIPAPSVNVPTGVGSKAMSYNIDLPDKLSPGLHTADVFILEVPSGPEISEANVRATIAVVTQLYVYVPYPGKYANAQMKIVSSNRGEDVAFIFPVVSAGEFDLTSVRANVDIFNKLDEKVASFDTDSIAVPSGTKKEIVHTWNADVPIGEYRVAATLIYDEGTLSLEGIFSVGSRDLELEDVSVNGFSLGQIAKLEMLVENKWSESITGAHINTKIMNERGDIVSEFDSASYDIDPLSKQTFVSYWDTAGVRVGTYETKVSINYGDASSVKNLQFQVEDDELTIIGLGYVISAEGGDGGGNTLMMVLIIMVGLLILINILWFFFFRRKMK